MIHRRDFLKLASVATGGLFLRSKAFAQMMLSHGGPMSRVAFLALPTALVADRSFSGAGHRSFWMRKCRLRAGRSPSCRS